MICDIWADPNWEICILGIEHLTCSECANTPSCSVPSCSLFQHWTCSSIKRYPQNNLRSRRLCSGVFAGSERWTALYTSYTLLLHCHGSSEGRAFPALHSVVTQKHILCLTLRKRADILNCEQLLQLWDDAYRHFLHVFQCVLKRLIFLLEDLNGLLESLTGKKEIEHVWLTAQYVLKHI